MRDLDEDDQTPPPARAFDETAAPHDAQPLGRQLSPHENDPTSDGDLPETEAVHNYFELTYARHLVLPRVLLQSMPDWWQSQFVRLLEQYDAATRHVERPQAYEVVAARIVEYDCLSEGEMKLLDVDVQEPEGDDRDSQRLYYDRNGTEHLGWHRALVPCHDPLPPYDRGRTRIPLNIPKDTPS